MEILGHSQISITIDAYTHVEQDTQREAMSHVDRLLRRRVPRDSPLDLARLWHGLTLDANYWRGGC